MVENVLILSKINNVADIVNNFFTDFVPNLKFQKYQDESIRVGHIENSVLKAPALCKEYSSIFATKIRNWKKKVSFSHIQKSYIKQEILNLDFSEACRKSEVPTKLNQNILILLILKM